MKTKISILLCLTFLTTGCSTLVQKIAVGETSSLLLNASDELWYETDLQLVEQGTPGLIKLIEGLHFVEPKNTNLLSSLTKAYAGFGFLKHETKLIKYQLLDEENPKLKKQLEGNYSKAISYGFKFLKESGVDPRNLFSNASNPEKLMSFLDKLDVNKSSLEAVFFTGQSLGSLIILNRDDLRMIAQRSIASTMFEWVCGHDPNFNEGSCYIFKAMNLSLTPTMLGGDPVKGKALFKEGIQSFPQNWIIRTAMLRYNSIPQEDEDEYQSQKAFFIREKKKYNDSLIYKPGVISKKSKNALFQGLALKRFDIIRSVESELF